MKVFLIDNNKIIKYVIPLKIDEAFSITYSCSEVKDCLISFGVVNGKHYIISNGATTIIEDNQELDRIAIENYQKYTLKIVGKTNPITLYFLPVKEAIFKLDFTKLDSFSVGSSDECNICYKNSNLADVQAMLKKVGEDWIITGINDDNYKIYINNSRATLKKLKSGDVVFIEGLKIIWMSNFIYVNNPQNILRITGMKLINDTPSELKDIPPVSEDEKAVELYNIEDYFVHFPTIKEQIEEKTVAIDPPPANQMREDLPFLLTIGSMVVMLSSSLVMGYNVVNGLANGKTITDVLPQLIMCVALIFGSVIMPRVTKSYQKKKAKKREELRQTKYTEYLNNKTRELDLLVKNELQILNDHFLSLENCLNSLNKQNANFWWRQYSDPEFLAIRVGVGRLKSNIIVKAPEEHFHLDDDNLLDESYKIKGRYEYIENAPIVVSLLKNNLTSLVANSINKEAFVKNILTQLLILHSYADLKIIVFTSEERSNRWEFIKYVPHTFSNSKDIRFFANNPTDAKFVSNYLEEELRSRREVVEDNSNKTIIPKPYYLIITDNYMEMKTIPIIDELINRNAVNLGFSLFIIEDSIKKVPNTSQAFIEIFDKDGVVIEKEGGLNSQHPFILEKVSDDYEINSIVTHLFNIPVLTESASGGLPTTLSFLDMYGVSKIEQLNIVNRWQTNNPVVSLDTVVGVHPNGEKFQLDLHEKFHGPHGLIAGSTGSGKSEFIITYILSMAINYHPYEVQFVLIDYKGGGLAGAFENKETGVKLPHLTGTITNLDKSELNRSLASIKSELNRRQKMFNEVRDRFNEGTVDIYKYQKMYRDGLVDKPLSHLFIISDEFAELKQQQPEFIEQLISTSRIGRSLGIHLILATQKPSGVVNDQIWANSKFKVCLKVQDKSDSMEMLKRPEAASIKETGRFYLQVGYNDLFEIGQSGWTGAKYLPSDKITLKVDESINYIDNVGYILKSVKAESDQVIVEDFGDQLVNIVKYLSKLGTKENIVTKKLWLDAIPDIIYINDIKQKYNYQPIAYYINPVVGEYDDPINQRQSILNIDLSRKGNLLIYGVPGSGKENFLMTVIRSVVVEHTPDEVNIYIIDCGSESLKIYDGFPHVGDVVTIDEEAKMRDLVNMLNDEVTRRKRLLASYSGSYNDYITNSGQKIPVILVVLNNYDIFAENFGSENEIMQTLWRDGYKYGIVFIVTAISTSVIKMKSLSYFNNKICLKLANDTDYKMVINAPRDLIPSDYFGRGLVVLDEGIFEFQTAVFGDSKDYTNDLRELSKVLNSSYTTKAKKIPTIPDIVYITDIYDKIMGALYIPIGFNTKNKAISYLDFKDNRKIYPIIFNAYDKNKKAFLTGLIKILSISAKVKVLSARDDLDISLGNVEQVNNDFDDYVKDLLFYSSGLSKDPNEIYYIINGLSDLKNKMQDNNFTALINFLNKGGSKVHGILLDTKENLSSFRLEPWFKTSISLNNYLWLGEGIASQSITSDPNLSFEEKKIMFKNIGYIVKDGYCDIIKYAIDREIENEK